MTKTKRVLRVLFQACVISVTTLVLTEVAFRVHHYFRPSFIFYDPSYNRFRGKPHAPDYDFFLNSKGFKDVEFKKEKEPGTYRIVALGDSFAYGVVPYKYNYLTLLEENLNREGKKNELLNMGIVATGPKDYLALLANEGLELKPDMVLVSFFIGNDFMREGGVRKLYSYSYVATFIGYLIAITTSYQGQVVHGPAVYDDNAPTLTDASFIDVENQRSEMYRDENKRFKTDFESAVTYLILIKKLCDERNIRLAVVLIPDDVQVDQKLQARVLRIKESTSARFDFTLPNRLLAANLKEQHIEFLDLFDEFARVGKQTALYKPDDTHWNIAGNRLAAEVIARDLFHVPASAPTPVK